MNERTVPRDRKVCFWCRFLDHSEPSCRKNAPIPVWEPNQYAPTPKADWPRVTPDRDWCAEFEEGESTEATRREPQPSDENYDLRVVE